MSLNLCIRAHDLSFTTMNGLILQLHKYNLTTIQFAPKKCFPEMGDLSQSLARQFSNKFKSERVTIGIQGCYVPLGDPDYTNRHQAIHQFIRAATLTHVLHAQYIATECGGKDSLKDNSSITAYQRVLDSFSQILLNIPSNTHLAIEPGTHSPIYSAAILRRLLNDLRAPNAHALIDGANLMTPDNIHEPKRVLDEALETLDSDIVAMHLKNAQLMNGQIQIVRNGHGIIDYSPWLKYIKNGHQGIIASLEATQAPFIAPAIADLQAKYATL